MDHTSTLEKVIRGILLALVVIFFMFPIFWIFLMSFQTNESILRIPPSLAFTPTLENYREVLGEGSFSRYLTNSLIVGIVSTVITLVLAALVLNETITVSDLAGTALVLIGVGLFTALDRRG